MAAHALVWAAVLVGGERLLHPVSTTLVVHPATAGLVTLALVAVLVLGLGVVDGLFFRSRRLVVVWPAALVLYLLVSGALSLRALLRSADLAYRPRSELIATVLPGLAAGSLAALLALGAAAAAGVGIGLLLRRAGRTEVRPEPPGASRSAGPAV